METLRRGGGRHRADCDRAERYQRRTGDRADVQAGDGAHRQRCQQPGAHSRGRLDLTHVGRPVSDIVQLTWNSSDTCFKRQSPAGVLESDCYIPPNGRSLVITDVQWRAHYGVLSRPGAYGDVVFVLPSGTIAYSFSALIDAEQFVSGFQGLQTGFVFHPDLLVVPFDAVARVYGYVVPSE